MSDNGCCGTKGGAVSEKGYEVARIEKTNFSCSLCEEYAERQNSKPVVVMSCEGACLRGEVSRQAANILCLLFLSLNDTQFPDYLDTNF